MGKWKRNRRERKPRELAGSQRQCRKIKKRGSLASATGQVGEKSKGQHKARRQTTTGPEGSRKPRGGRQGPEKGAGLTNQGENRGKRSRGVSSVAKPGGGETLEGNRAKTSLFGGSGTPGKASRKRGHIQGKESRIDLWE